MVSWNIPETFEKHGTLRLKRLQESSITGACWLYHQRCNPSIVNRLKKEVYTSSGLFLDVELAYIQLCEAHPIVLAWLATKKQLEVFPGLRQLHEQPVCTTALDRDGAQDHCP